MEKKLLAYCIKDKKYTLELIQKKIESSYFADDTAGTLFKILCWFFREYDCLPTKEALLEALNQSTLTDSLKGTVPVLFIELQALVVVEPFNFILDVFLKDYKERELRKTLMSVVDVINSGRIEEAISHTQRTLSTLSLIGSNDVREGDYRDSVTDRLNYYEKVKEGKIPQGILYGYPSLDSITGGQLSGELWIVMGLMKHGKCNKFDTPIQTVDGTIIPICKVKKGQQILTLDDNYKLVPATVIDNIYNGKKQLYKITTRLGRTVEATDNHPFLMATGWTQLKDLKVGGRIATPRRLSLNLPEYNITDEEIIFTSLFIAEGSYLPSKIYTGYVGGGSQHFTNYDIDVMNTFKHCLDKMGLVVGYTRPDEGNIRLNNGDSRVADVCNKLGINRAHSLQKTLPAWVFRLSDRQLALFLGAYFSGDGGVENKKRINYYASSKTLAFQLQTLLLRLGLNAQINTKRSSYTKEGIKKVLDHPSYSISIESTNEVLSFITQIRPYIIGKEKLAYVDAVYNICNKIIAKPWNDVIPNPIMYVRQKYNKYVKTLLGDYKTIGRDRLLNASKVYNDKYLRDLATSDIYWDEIVSIEKTQIEDVYDLEIDHPCHNFVANNIVAHNSAIMLNMANFAWKTQHKNVLYVSAEVSRAVLERRLDALNAEISCTGLKQGTLADMDMDRFKATLDDIKKRESMMYIMDTPAISTAGIHAKIQELKSKGKLDLVVVDYLALISPVETAKEDWKNIGNIALELRRIARTEGIPILTAHQTNAEGYKAKTIDGSHISRSKDIGRHCDLILSIKLQDEEAKRFLPTCLMDAAIIMSRDSASTGFVLEANFDRMCIKETLAVSGGHP